jgi:hypothetical protein
VALDARLEVAEVVETADDLVEGLAGTGSVRQQLVNRASKHTRQVVNRKLVQSEGRQRKYPHSACAFRTGL